MSRHLKCPKCRSTDIRVLGRDHKGFSIGKALGGALIVAPAGLLAGFLGKKGKYEVFCADCGHRFKVR